MDFAFTAEHEELRQTVRRFLEREFPEARVRVLMPSSLARWFISSTNASEEPATVSATATEASLAEWMAIASIISERGKVSPCFK